MFLKKEKDPTNKLFDDDERMRSLAVAQAVAPDMPEGRTKVELTLKKKVPSRWRSFCEKVFADDS